MKMSCFRCQRYVTLCHLVLKRETRTVLKYGNHYLDAVREIRKRFPEVHIFGGHSNTSFGLPNRKVVNNAFIMLSILAGCDTLMIDPVMNPPQGFVEFRLATDAVLGKDELAMRYVACRRN